MADIQGHGTVLVADTTTSFTASTTLGVITNISGPNETAGSIEVTDFDSEAAEFVPGLLEPGEMTLDLKYYATNASAIRTLEERSDSTNTLLYYKVTLNDHETAASRSWWYCKGAITSLGHTIPFDDMVKQSVTIKFSGPSVASFDS